MNGGRGYTNTQPPSAGLRRYLYFTAAVAGAVIMIVEILGTKMLSPYFGTSHFVWTAQIAVTLVALATGYYGGGRLVDHSPKLCRLYWMILVTAVYLGLTVPLVKPVAYACLHLNLAVGSLLASTFLFFTPLALLAVVGPFFVRVLTVTVASVGGSAGRITAIGTLGSFAGTVLIGYVLIPFLPNSVTMSVTSVALVLVAIGYFWGWGRKQRLPAAGVGVLGLMIGGIGAANDQPASGNGWREIHRANSAFGQLQVISAQSDTHRYFLTDFLTQNTYDPVRKSSTSAFTYLLHDLAYGYTSNIQDVLCIGLGIGIVPMQFAREGARVDVVEINPAVVPVAEKFFDLEPARFDLTIDDGRHFLNRCAKHYDAICLDAFLGDASPSHLMSREAFAAMRRILKPDGVLVVNSYGHLEPENDFVTASLDKTLRAVFRNVRIHSQSSGNVFFVASNQPELELQRPPNLLAVHEGCREEVRVTFGTIRKADPRHGIVVTDDYNPIDYYDAANREAVRKRLALRMKQ